MSKAYYNTYPNVFIHGFNGYGDPDGIDKKLPYWGLPENNVLDYLESRGYECIHPSVGPHNSAWDRCCELYARLVGGTVDYGKAHSEKFGHKRYGRTFEGALTDWGQPGPHAKINLLGHSFGGPTVRLFAELMANGSAEERAVTPEDELSPLFKGGQAQLIHTVTTMSGVNNGTTMASLLGRYGAEKIIGAIGTVNILVSRTEFTKYFDFDTDQWELQPDPWSVSGNKFTNPFSRANRSKLKKFKTAPGDSMFKELTVDFAAERNSRMSVESNIYYFAERSQRCRPVKFGRYLPTEENGPVTKLTGIFSGTYLPHKLKKYGVDKTWLPNDGMVNVKSQGGPLNQPSIEYPGTAGCVPDAKLIKPGVWFNMPVENLDHMSWASVAVPTEKYFSIYENLLDLFRQLPDA